MHAEHERVAFDARLLRGVGGEVGVEPARQVVAEERGEDGDQRERDGRPAEAEGQRSARPQEPLRPAAARRRRIPPRRAAGPTAGAHGRESVAGSRPPRPAHREEEVGRGQHRQRAREQQVGARLRANGAAPEQERRERRHQERRGLDRDVRLVAAVGELQPGQDAYGEGDEQAGRDGDDRPCGDRGPRTRRRGTPFGPGPAGNVVSARISRSDDATFDPREDGEQVCA